jgi:predicted metal-dependent phosphotriesterase family hydrolase
VQLADIFIGELTDHLPGSELRASAIIVECTEQIEPFDEIATLAACFAHAETAAPILVRAPAGAAVGRVDRLVGRGVDPERILVLGLDDATTTAQTLEALISRGVVMGITSIGDEEGLSLDARCAMLAFILRSAGPSRVALGTGSALFRPAPGKSPAESGLPETALACLLDRAREFGIDDELSRAALTDGAHALLAPVALRADGLAAQPAHEPSTAP